MVQVVACALKSKFKCFNVEQSWQSQIVVVEVEVQNYGIYTCNMIYLPNDLLLLITMIAFMEQLNSMFSRPTMYIALVIIQGATKVLYL